MDISRIKASGKEAFKANYWSCVVAALLLGLLTMGTTAATGNNVKNADNTQAEQGLKGALDALTSNQQLALLSVVLGASVMIMLISLLLRIFVFNPLTVGAYRFFRKNARDTGTGIGTILEGFSDYGHIFVTLLLRDIFLYLWTLLFIIPGIIKTYSYMLVPYIIKDNPELSATEALNRSRNLMDGHKWEAFMLDLSFIGWFLLGLITGNLVNIFWTDPYRESARAMFYLDLLEAH